MPECRLKERTSERTIASRMNAPRRHRRQRDDEDEDEDDDSSTQALGASDWRF